MLLKDFQGNLHPKFQKAFVFKMRRPGSLSIVVMVVVTAFFFHSVAAADADPYQDFCVADLSKDLTINGYVCKNSSLATADDFIFHGLKDAGDTKNSVGAAATFGFVDDFPGLNSLGLAIARLDFAKDGLIPPHTHPRASEIIYVVEGSLYAGFVTTDNKLFAKVINKGDVMMFPRGLIHWQLNVGNSTALGIVTLNSQSPGFQLIANSMFGSNILDRVLMKTFFIDEKAVKQLKSIFG